MWHALHIPCYSIGQVGGRNRRFGTAFQVCSEVTLGNRILSERSRVFRAQLILVSRRSTNGTDVSVAILLALYNTCLVIYYILWDSRSRAYVLDGSAKLSKYLGLFSIF